MRRSDDELMLAYAGGERGALVELMRRFAPALMLRVSRELGDASPAQGLTQETFIELHRARFDFRRGMSVGAWIETIATRLVRARGRERRGAAMGR